MEFVTKSELSQLCLTSSSQYVTTRDEPLTLELARSSLSPHEQRMQREQAAGLPPRRDQIQYGERGEPAGDERFRADRESWYERFTGYSLVSPSLQSTVSLQEQNELCDVR
jgi:hypothetical protein